MEQSIPDRFERQVAVHGDRIAVGEKGRILTYRELNASANRVARVLLEGFGKTDRPVALLMGKGAMAIAALLGILKAGRFYLPIDPSYPEARSRYILRDSGADLIVTDGRHASLARRLAGGTVSLLDAEGIGREVSGDNLGLSIAPTRIASILYTSGSTGSPKGVAQSHRNLLHYAMKATNWLHVSMNDRLTQLPSLSHTAAIADMRAALLNGAAIFPLDVRQEGFSQLADWLRQNEITVCHMVPTLFRHFASSLAEPLTLPSLRLIWLGGEPVLRHHVALYKKLFPPHTLLRNGLGATEISTTSHYFIDHDTGIEDSLVPVGYAMDDTDILLLDENGNEVETGQVGEITIRSEFLSPGYWRGGELDEASFPRDPHSPGSPIYRTGDLGRLAPDGCLTHLGRKDFQVKVRGHRVEPSEVEMALLDLPGIEEAAVVGRQIAPGTTTLVAYFVMAGSRIPSVGELRASLKKHLPDHMIPSAFVPMDRLPLNPNGKVDRLSLPDPVAVLAPGTRRVVAPRNEIESQLIAIWEDLLQVRPVGVEDDFFDLGGDSLLATQLVLEVERRLGKSIPVSCLIENTTVERVASAVARGADVENWFSLVRIQPTGAKPGLFFVHGIGGDVMYCRGLARHLPPDQPVFGIQAHRVGDDHLFSVQAAAGCYARAIRQIQPRGPYHLAGFSAAGVWAYEIARQLRSEGHEVGLVALVDTGCPWHGRVLLSRRLRRHLHRMLSMAVREKVSYFAARAPVAVRLARRGMSQLAVRWCRTSVGTVPPGFRTVATAARAALRGYRPQEYQGRLTLFWADDETSFELYDRDPRLGWHRLASEGVDVHHLSGDHTSIIQERNVSALAELFTIHLSEFGS